MDAVKQEIFGLFLLLWLQLHGTEQIPQAAKVKKS